MPKRKLDVSDLIALDKQKQSEFQEKSEKQAKKAKKLVKAGEKLEKSRKTGVLHVRQLPRVLDEQDLRDYFVQFGKVKRVKGWADAFELTILVFFRILELKILENPIEVIMSSNPFFLD